MKNIFSSKHIGYILRIFFSNKKNAITKKLPFLLTVLLIFAGCTTITVIPPTSDITNYKNGVIILEEGAFNSGNGSISWYNPAENKVENDLYYHINNEPLGDVVQSIRLINNNLYIVVNNSGKIVYMHPTTFKKLGELKNLPSPRYILPINSTQAYISNLVLNNGQTAIQKVDLSTNQVIASIPTQFAEEMVQVATDNNAVWTGITNTKWLLRINTTTDKVTDTLRLTDSPKHLFLDKNGVSLWIVCEGNYRGGTPSICKVNTQTKQIEQRLDFPTGTNTIGAFCYSEKYNCIYYVYTNKVWKMSIFDTQLPATSFVANPGIYPYGIGVAANGEVYISDAKDFSQKGSVTIYNPDGTKKHTFDTGIAPSGFLFQ